MPSSAEREIPFPNPSSSIWLLLAAPPASPSQQSPLWAVLIASLRALQAAESPTQGRLQHLSSSCTANLGSGIVTHTALLGARLCLQCSGLLHPPSSLPAPAGARGRRFPVWDTSVEGDSQSGHLSGRGFPAWTQQAEGQMCSGTSGQCLFSDLKTTHHLTPPVGHHRIQ